MSKSPGRNFSPPARFGRGFTMIELMITVAIVAILAAIAFPSFHEFMIRQNTITVTNDLIGSINTARGEAVKRGTAVRVVPDAGGWRAGWTVNADMAHDNTFSTIVTTHPAIPDTYFIQAKASGGGNDGYVEFNASGALAPMASSYDFNVCRPSASADSSQSRRVSVSSGGTVTTHRDINIPTASPAGSC